MYWEVWVEKGESHLNTIHGQGIVYCPPLSSWLACVRISNLKSSSSSSSTKNGDYSWSVSSDSWRIYSKFHLECFTFQHGAFWSAFLQTTKSIRCIFTIVALIRFFACVIFQMSPQSGGMGCLVVWAIGRGHELSLFKNWISLLWYLEKVTPQIMIA